MKILVCICLQAGKSDSAMSLKAGYGLLESWWVLDTYDEYIAGRDFGFPDQPDAYGFVLTERTVGSPTAESGNYPPLRTGKTI